MGRLNVNTRIVLLALMASFCSILVNAQQVDKQTLMESFPKEEVILVANAEVLLSGQMLGYSIFCNAKNVVGSISDVIYVELISDNKTSVFKNKLRLTNGKAYGDYFLPTTVKTGNYKLVAYTSWSLNNSEDAFAQKDIYIINPYLNAFENNLKSKFVENEEYTEISLSQQVDFKNNNEVNGLKITTDSDSYKTRTKVNLNLQNTSNTINYGTFTVLVKKIDSIKIQNHYITKNPSQKASTSAYLPEMRGELIKGTVIDLRTNVPAVDQAVSLSIAGEHPVYKSAKTNAEGQFYFNLFENHEVEKALIQVLADNRNDFKLTIEPKGFDRYDDLEFYPLKLNNNLKSYITQNSIFNQVESAYYNLKSDSLLVKSPSKSFYGSPDIVYVLDDFTRFNSVKETFIEVVQDAAIRSHNDGYQFMVYDLADPFGSAYASIKPLLLLDGIQIQEEKIVVDYKPEEIESVSLVKGVYALGSVTYNGIIDIKLKKPSNLNMSGSYIKDLEVQKPIVPKEYFKQRYTTDKKRTPDFRTQLLWQPNVELNTDSETIDFYTSDVPGYYRIELTGISTDGKSFQLSEIFKVVN